jgi:hypothetical protein
MIWRTRGVATAPGQTQLTLMSCGERIGQLPDSGLGRAVGQTIDVAFFPAFGAMAPLYLESCKIDAEALEFETDGGLIDKKGIVAFSSS